MTTTADARTRSPTRMSLPRLLAGLFAGLVGGLAFGALMVAPAVMDGDGGFQGMGMLHLVGNLLGVQRLPVLWLIHLANSAFFGVLFAAFVAPRGKRRTVGLAVGWSVLLWLVGAFLLLNLVVGESLALTLGVAYNLLGHLAYGAALGLVYLAFFREEMGLLRDHPRKASARRAAPKP